MLINFKQLEEAHNSTKEELKELFDTENSAREIRERIDHKIEEFWKLRSLAIKEFTKKSQRIIIFEHKEKDGRYYGDWKFGVNQNGIGYLRSSWNKNLYALSGESAISEVIRMFTKEPKAKKKLFDYLETELKNKPEQLEIVKKCFDLVNFRNDRDAENNTIKLNFYGAFSFQLGKKDRDSFTLDDRECFEDLRITALMNFRKILENKTTIIELAKIIHEKMVIQEAEVDAELSHYKTILAPYLALKEL